MSRRTKYEPFARARILGVGGVALALALGAVMLDAGARRTAEQPASEISRAVVRALGTPDLALSSSSRWLRHPSQTEPGAPFADAPASLDTDPGASVIGPPRELLGVGARNVVVRRGGAAP